MAVKKEFVNGITADATEDNPSCSKVGVVGLPIDEDLVPGNRIGGSRNSVEIIPGGRLAADPTKPVAILCVLALFCIPIN